MTSQWRTPQAQAPFHSEACQAQAHVKRAHLPLYRARPEPARWWLGEGIRSLFLRRAGMAVRIVLLEPFDGGGWGLRIRRCQAYCKLSLNRLLWWTARMSRVSSDGIVL